MTDNIINGYIIFAVTCIVILLIVVISFLKSKNKPELSTNDPLSILREDTYTNEETDEINQRSLIKIG